MSARSLILASASPRRQELLRQIGVQFTVAPQDIDETIKPGETAVELVCRLAEQKAQAALHSNLDSASVVLGSDTVVVLGESILGKPRSESDACAMLAMLSGKEHRVLTAVCVADDQRSETRLSDSVVGFREIDPQEAIDYWNSGEPQGKAGSYAVQGLGAVFVQSLSGSYSGVMGLPLFETAQLLQEFNVPCWHVMDRQNNE